MENYNYYIFFDKKEEKFITEKEALKPYTVYLAIDTNKKGKKQWEVRRCYVDKNGNLKIDDNYRVDDLIKIVTDILRDILENQGATNIRIQNCNGIKIILSEGSLDIEQNVIHFSCTTGGKKLENFINPSDFSCIFDNDCININTLNIENMIIGDGEILNFGNINMGQNFKSNKTIVIGNKNIDREDETTIVTGNNNKVGRKGDKIIIGNNNEVGGTGDEIVIGNNNEVGGTGDKIVIGSNNIVQMKNLNATIKKDINGSPTEVKGKENQKNKSNKGKTVNFNIQNCILSGSKASKGNVLLNINGEMFDFRKEEDVERFNKSYGGNSRTKDVKEEQRDK